MANEGQIYIEERADRKFAIRRGNLERASGVEVARQMFPGIKPHTFAIMGFK